MVVKFKKLSPHAVTPSYQTEGSSGMDISACIQESIVVNPMSVALIPTGIAIEIPSGFEAQLRPRSGLALKYLISLPNSPSTIDSDYRGEIKVIIINHGNNPFTVQNGDRIAQMVFAKVEIASFEETQKLSDTSRGKGGFGHTGMKVAKP